MEVNSRPANAASAKHTCSLRAFSPVCPIAGQSGQAHMQWQTMIKGGKQRICKERQPATLPTAACKPARGRAHVNERTSIFFFRKAGDDKMSSAVVSASAAGSPSAGTSGTVVASGAAAASALSSAAAGASALSSPSAGGGVGGVAPPSIRSPAGRRDAGARRVQTAARGEGASGRGARAVRKAGMAMVPSCAKQRGRSTKVGCGAQGG